MGSRHDGAEEKGDEVVEGAVRWVLQNELRAHNGHLTSCLYFCSWGTKATI
jgi:hypothetical protein